MSNRVVIQEGYIVPSFDGVPKRRRPHKLAGVIMSKRKSKSLGDVAVIHSHKAHRAMDSMHRLTRLAEVETRNGSCPSAFLNFEAAVKMYGAAETHMYAADDSVVTRRYAKLNADLDKASTAFRNACVKPGKR